MPTKEKMDFQKVRTKFFFGLILIFAVAFLYIIAPYSYPIFWAAVFAITFYPLHKLILRHIKMPSLSAGVTTVIAFVAVLLPLFIIGMLLIREASDLYDKVATTEQFMSIEGIQGSASQIPYIGPYIDQNFEQITANVASGAKNVSLWIVRNLGTITQSSFQFFFMLFIMFYTLFYFLKDGREILHKLLYLSPLGDEYEEMLYDRFTSTARATLKGTFIIGGIQGTLGGIIFWLTGIEGALIWGVLMIFLSIIPAAGSALVWVPAGIIMLLLGNTWEGLVILLFGGLVISTIDNLLRPVLVGRDIQMHSLLVLFSTLGGIAIFGITGFVIGPVITALFLSILSIYEHYYKKELKDN